MGEGHYEPCRALPSLPVLIPAIHTEGVVGSSDFHPGKCQLLVVREDWEAKGGDTKFGLCSSLLTFLRPGAYCLGHSTHSVMQIPDDKTVHVFMAGLGTGLAPFRAYVEQRKFQKTQALVKAVASTRLRWLPNFLEGSDGLSEADVPRNVALRFGAQ